MEEADKNGIATEVGEVVTLANQGEVYQLGVSVEREGRREGQLWHVHSVNVVSISVSTQGPEKKVALLESRFL